MLFALCLLAAAQDDLPSFGHQQRLAAAYYYSGPDARPRHELQEMGRVGIDIAVVAAGTSDELAALVAALDGLEKEGRDRPRLAAFVAGGDPATAGAFVRIVPARHWARLEGRQIVWLGPAPPDGERPGLDGLKTALGGRTPYLVADLSWKGLPADRFYAWGASHQGPRDDPVVSVGPGSLEPPRDREDGKFYERSWFKALRLEPRLVVIETWNGPGTGVHESPEHGRKYLEATARFVRHCKVAEKITLPKGKLTGAAKVQYTLQYNPREQGLRPVAVEDGLFDVIQLRGIAVLSTKENPRGPRRQVYFDVDDSFCYFDKRPFQVTVEFLDSGEGSFSLEYDSGDRTLGLAERTFKRAGEVRFTGTGEWRTETFALPDGAFGNGQPGGADFRLAVEKRGLTLRRVVVASK